PGTQKKLRLFLQRVEKGSVKLDKDGKPSTFTSKRVTHAVNQAFANRISTPKNESDRTKQLNGLFKLIDNLKKNPLPSGVKISEKAIDDDVQKEEFTKILGEGMLGKVVLKEKGGQTAAEKSVFFASFNKNEVQCMLDLEDSGYTPTLYKVWLDGHDVKMQMEHVDKGTTMQDVIDCENVGYIQDKNLKSFFSIYVIHELTSAINQMQSKGWQHKDMHAGNVLLQNKEGLPVKIIDFGSATSTDPDDPISLQAFRDDMRNAIRIYIALVTGYMFGNIMEMSKENVEEVLNEYTQDFSLDQQNDIKQIVYTIIEGGITLASRLDFEKLIKSKLPNTPTKLKTLEEVRKKLFPDVDVDLHSVDGPPHQTYVQDNKRQGIPAAPPPPPALQQKHPLHSKQLGGGDAEPCEVTDSDDVTDYASQKHLQIATDSSELLSSSGSSIPELPDTLTFCDVAIDTHALEEMLLMQMCTIA
ncbi:unnamed protein product, partial [Owenia fusiformis]